MVENVSYHQPMNPGHSEIKFGFNAGNFVMIYMMKNAEKQPKTTFSKNMRDF